jgi:hypothetical protein
MLLRPRAHSCPYRVSVVVRHPDDQGPQIVEFASVVFAVPKVTFEAEFVLERF